MRIAQLTPYYPPHTGGVEVYVRELTNMLRDRGHDVSVYTTDVGTSDDTDRQVKRFRALPLDYAPFVPHLSTKLDRALESVDLVHTHLPPPFFAAAAPDYPHVLTYHCDFVLPSQYHGLPIPSGVAAAAESLYRQRYRDTVESADKVIATTSRYAETSSMLRETSYQVIPAGVDPDQFTPRTEKEPALLFVGRLAASKGLDILLKAAPAILTETPIEEIRIVGDGEDRQRLERKARRLAVSSWTGSSGGVSFLGLVSFDRLKCEYAHARATVLPSTSRLEAFGLVQLESMASGTPVVVSDIPGPNGVPEQGKTGFLFEPGDPKALTEAVDRLCSNTNPTVTARRARQYVEERYSWDQVTDQVEAVYQRAIEC